MKAICWEDAKSVKVQSVDDPDILNPRDAIVRVTSTAICGSDLHLYNGFFPGVSRGDILGHECMGEVVAVGSAVNTLAPGDRVVVPCVIACGSCAFCVQRMYSACDNSNAKPIKGALTLGYPGSGMLGYAEVTGGYAGGQAEYVRYPLADFGLLRVPNGIPDERLLFLSDILPTGWMGAENCNVHPGDVVAVWGAGPVGLMAAMSLKILGAERVISIDTVPERLELARRAGAETFDASDGGVYEHLLQETAGRGPDACLDAVGMEAHGLGPLGAIDKLKQKVNLQTDRPAVLREVMHCVRKGGTISLLGVYGGKDDGVPMGQVFNKGVTMNMGQVVVQAYHHMLLDMILKDQLDPSFIITHTMSLDDAPETYKMFNDKSDGCVKVVLKPALGRANGSNLS